MTSKVILLGTGSPRPSHIRFQSSSAVVANGQPYIIDCGAGVMQRIAEAFDLESEPIMPKLTQLFLTHLHPDHTAGIADFLITPWIMQRKEPVHIYGPKGTGTLVEHTLKAMKIGMDAHIDNEGPTRWPFLHEVHEYTAGEIFKDENVTITAFLVDHGVLETYGLEVQTTDKRIVFSGDTCKNDNVIKFAKGCDLLVHEVYSKKGLEISPAWFPRPYFTSIHTSSVELAEIGRLTNPKRIVLNHVMHLGDVTDEEFMAEITNSYDGEVIMGNDLDVFE